MIAYIQEQGARISKEGRRLIVTFGEEKRTLFIDQLEQVLIFGNVQMTTQALLLLLEEDIDTVFLRYDGRYVGRLANKDPANVFLRKRQFALLDDSAFCVNVARCIVRGKLTNQATVLARIRRARNQVQAGEAAKDLRELAAKADNLEDLDALRGLEGSGAALYFKHLHLAFTEDWGFTKRVRRPPTDPVNAVLSLLYTLLTNRCYAAVRIAGLDPYPAMLHSLAYGRESLPLDLVEEFRAMLADTLTIAIFNMRILKKEDFVSPPPPEEPKEEESDSVLSAVLADPLGTMSCEVGQTECDIQKEQAASPQVALGKQPVLLTSDAYKRVLTIFAKKMESEFYHPLAERQMTYNEALLFQARQYRRLVEGELETYTPLTLR